MTLIILGAMHDKLIGFLILFGINFSDIELDFNF
tara:strand:+ start:221 stop:322 length:102 start_codon:yes stop_codon:yes gene_type:complete